METETVNKDRQYMNESSFIGRIFTIKTLSLSSISVLCTMYKPSSPLVPFLLIGIYRNAMAFMVLGKFCNYVHFYLLSITLLLISNEGWDIYFIAAPF